MNISTLKEPRRLNTRTPFSSLKTASRFALALVCLLAAGAAVAKQEKTLICHVGNELGSDGATYLENPDCTPPEGYTAEDYVCPDAGKVDLIVVAKARKHLENESHFWDGMFDYEPSEVGASGQGTDDSNGDGIDDGCEPAAAACPCWDEAGLQQIVNSAQNLEERTINPTTSCIAPDYPGSATLEDENPPFNEKAVGFFASVSGETPICGLKPSSSIIPPMTITAPEAEACVAQIAARCAGLGYPITN